MVSRREFLKAAIAGSAVSYMILKKDELTKVLKPVKLEDILGDAIAVAQAATLEEKAKRKELELKKKYAKEVEQICKEKGTESEECKLAKKKLEMIRVKATKPRKNTKYAMALDINKCIGCRRCAYACVMENNMDRSTGIEWIKVLGLKREEFEILFPDLDYKDAPLKEYVYVPMACMHCEDPPCVMVCPVRATWKEPDGIVVIDYDKCIGCRYCVTACPYGARRFDWKKPEVSILDLNPNMHILGNTPRPIHVAEKCSWCIQRTRDGGVPACVEVCPVGARSFGNLLDPKSPIRRIIEEYGAFVLKPEAGTKPKFFYYFGPARTPPREGSEEEQMGGGEEQ